MGTDGSKQKSFNAVMTLAFLLIIYQIYCFKDLFSVLGLNKQVKVLNFDFYFTNITRLLSIVFLGLVSYSAYKINSVRTVGFGMAVMIVNSITEIVHFSKNLKKKKNALKSKNRYSKDIYKINDILTGIRPILVFLVTVLFVALFITTIYAKAKTVSVPAIIFEVVLEVVCITIYFINYIYPAINKEVHYDIWLWIKYSLMIVASFVNLFLFVNICIVATSRYKIDYYDNQMLGVYGGVRG